MSDARIETPDLPTLFALLERLPTGVVLLDDTARVLLYNAAEERIARRLRADVLGRHFFDEIAPCIKAAGVGDEFFGRVGREAFEIEREVAFAFPFRDSPRQVKLKLFSVEAAGRPYGCLLIEDITAQRALERLKANLSSLLVHDMKNPLAAVLANLELLDLDPAAPPDREAVEGARVSARRLQRMVGGLLDIARLEDGAIPLQLSRTDLRQVADAALRGQTPLARMSRVELRQTSGAEAVSALIDPEIVRRALDNLIDNGLRYAPQGTSIDVYAEPGPRTGLVSLCVRDRGRGIPDSLRERIFEKYGQAEPGKRSGNQGLGLTFVRLAAEAHGGRASVESPDSGGCLFRIELPAA
jgi:photoactive yellow protein